ncbi:helix-turn-helix transcriptional regulator [Nocardia sp. CDC153]|uniref:helix-turn-helix transcriptional regulator n=1 Tax=Nocardia sp. CDC153 TaxID=3112167 RepID=UPI002DBB4BE7|nr:helix-turn-helix transcriptional regulator [Nocardia sp. CDC153]MEC3954518.1 helix-turn-helix transcriptional regulator [Nocardia sp. CDC153]
MVTSATQVEKGTGRVVTVGDWTVFGTELRRLREQQGMSVRQLGKQVLYDPSALSRFENGKRKPPADIVTRLDAALNAGGILCALYESLSGPDPFTPHEALQNRRYADQKLAGDLQAVLADTRRLEDEIGSKLVLPVTVRHSKIATALAREATSKARKPLVDAAAGWTQFHGWLNASLGRHDAAIHHYREALELAEEAGNADMVSTTLAMRGHVAWMAGDTSASIGLSQAAQRNPRNLSRTVLALAVQQEARGLGMEGDMDGMESKLDTATDLILLGDPDKPDAQYFYSDSFIRMQRGMAYRHARQWAKAIDALEHGLQGFDRKTLESEWATWYVAELAWSYAGIGEPEKAASLALRVVETGRKTPGSRLVGYMGELYQAMAKRYPGNASVAELGCAVDVHAA